MTAGWKVLVVLGLVVAVAGPIFTIHAALDHLLEAPTASWPPSDPGLFALAALGLVSLFPVMLGGRALPRLLSSTARASDMISSGEQKRLHGVDLVVLPTDELVICTAGIVRPRIAISRGAIECLDDAQLCAAVLHESAHVAAQDTRWRAGLAIFACAYSFVPSLHRTVVALHTAAEVRADSRALDGGASPLALFDALVKVSTLPSRRYAGAAQLDDGAIEIRLRRIAGSDQRAVPVPTSWPVGAALTTLLVVPFAAHILLAVEVLCHRSMG